MPQEQWPYQEAERILKRVQDKNAEIILQTGFGPSGFPHIGTFGEVTRTTFIRRALTDLGATNVRLIVFSDDMDGLRKVPLNFPESLAQHLGKPLNEIPDPFDCCESFSGHMNKKLNEMLQRFGFQYEFKSSVTQYKGGVFNDGLKKMLAHYEAVRAVILPTLGEEKRDAWSPFLPICPQCRNITTTRVTGYHPERGTVSFVCDGQVGPVQGCNNSGETPVTDGHCKVGWKPDWALRWYVYGVDYEMYGKDLIESATLSGRIVKALGGEPPLNYFFELFLDEDGKKISKSVGKGVTVDTWLRYAPIESLALFMLRNPRRAKKLFMKVIPVQFDELAAEIESHYAPNAKPPENGQRTTYAFLKDPPPPASPYPAGLRYNTIANLAGTLNTEDPAAVSQYVRKLFGWPEGADEAMKALIEGAMLFDRELADKREPYVLKTDTEREIVKRLHAYLADPHTGDEIQTYIYDIGKQIDVKSGEVFKTLYLTIISQERGPRLGLFIPVLGQEKVRELLAKALA